MAQWILITPSLKRFFTQRPRKQLFFLYGPFCDGIFDREAILWWRVRFMSTFTTFSCLLPSLFTLAFFGQIIFHATRRQIIFPWNCHLGHQYLTDLHFEVCFARLFDSNASFSIYCCEIELFMPSCGTALVVDMSPRNSLLNSNQLGFDKFHFSHTLAFQSIKEFTGVCKFSYRTSNIALPLGWTANQCRHFRSKWEIKFVFNLIFKAISAADEILFQLVPNWYWLVFNDRSLQLSSIPSSSSEYRVWTAKDYLEQRTENAKLNGVPCSAAFRDEPKAAEAHAHRRLSARTIAAEVVNESVSCLHCHAFRLIRFQFHAALHQPTWQSI